MKLLVLTLSFVVLAWPLSSSAQGGPPALRNNPFSRPPSNAIIDDRVSSGREAVDSTLALQATMIGTLNKLANVDGRILKPGDEIQGHMLVEVHERYAVFRRNGKDTTVYVKPQLAENQTAENDE